jgi:hypothetical protein
VSSGGGGEGCTHDDIESLVDRGARELLKRFLLGYNGGIYPYLVPNQLYLIVLNAMQLKKCNHFIRVVFQAQISGQVTDETSAFTELSAA